MAFFTKMWSPSTSQAEQLGYAYVYDERGTLVAEIGSRGTNSAGQASYIYLPTVNGPMPIAAIINGNTYAVHSDHLNTLRKLSNADGQAVWQWSYSAFGEDKSTLARRRFANPETTQNPGSTNLSEVKFKMSGKQLDKACRANGYEDAHAMKRDLGLDSKSDIFVDKNGNLYSGPRQGTGTPQYLHMNSSGITSAPSPAPPAP